MCELDFKRYFVYIQQVLHTQNCRVLMGDFKVPLFDYKLGLSSAISHYYNKLNGEAIFSSRCLLGLSQHNYPRNSGNLLNLEFSNFTYLSINYNVHVMVSPDTTVL
jgi:hypothetical protein